MFNGPFQIALKLVTPHLLPQRFTNAALLVALIVCFTPPLAWPHPCHEWIAPRTTTFTQPTKKIIKMISITICL